MGFARTISCDGVQTIPRKITCQYLFFEKVNCTLKSHSKSQESGDFTPKPHQGRAFYEKFMRGVDRVRLDCEIVQGTASRFY